MSYCFVNVRQLVKEEFVRFINLKDETKLKIAVRIVYVVKTSRLALEFEV